MPLAWLSLYRHTGCRRTDSSMAEDRDVGPRLTQPLYQLPSAPTTPISILHCLGSRLGSQNTGNKPQQFLGSLLHLAHNSSISGMGCPVTDVTHFSPSHTSPFPPLGPLCEEPRYCCSQLQVLPGGLAHSRPVASTG